MNRNIVRCLWGAGLSLIMGLGIAGGAWAEDDYRSARVSDLRGTLTLRGEEDDDASYAERNSIVREGDILWTDEKSQAELELERSTWVRLAEDSKVEVTGLDSPAKLRLWTGSVYLDISDRGEGLVVSTPAGDVSADPDSVVRVDMDKDERVRVTLLSGRAEVRPDRGGPQRLTSGDRIYLEDDADAEDIVRFDRDDRDGFDRYQRDRTDYFVERPRSEYLEEDLIGSRDLDDNGTWVEVENTRYWRPRAAEDWRPYSSGYWSYAPSFGYTWVDYAPWGYTTSHYGRWMYRPTYGWLWAPGRVWGPAWVSWSSYGDYCGWAPLDPWNRPCYYGGYGPGSGFSVAFGGGNCFIDYNTWTFCNRNDFFYGRHHRGFGNGRRYLVTGRDIHANAGGFRMVGSADRDFGVPRRFARGITVSPNGIPARERALRVENGIPGRRNSRIASRFQLAGNRDVQRLRQGSDIERFQRDSNLRVDNAQLFRGNDLPTRIAPRMPRGGNAIGNGGNDSPRGTITFPTPRDTTPGPGNDRPGTPGRNGVGDGLPGRGGNNGAGNDRPDRGGVRPGSGGDRDNDSPFRRGTRNREDQPGISNPRSGGNLGGGQDRGPRGDITFPSSGNPQVGTPGNRGTGNGPDNGIGIGRPGRDGSSGRGDRDGGFRRGGSDRGPVTFPSTGQPSQPSQPSPRSGDGTGIGRSNGNSNRPIYQDYPGGSQRGSQPVFRGGDSDGGFRRGSVDRGGANGGGYQSPSLPSRGPTLTPGPPSGRSYDRGSSGGYNSGGGGRSFERGPSGGGGGGGGRQYSAPTPSRSSGSDSGRSSRGSSDSSSRSGRGSSDNPFRGGRR